MLPTVHHLVNDDTEHFLLDAGLGHVRDVVCAEVDFFVVRVEVEARRVGYAVHVSQDERDGARRWYAVGSQSCVQVVEDAGDGVFEGVGGVDAAEEGTGAGGGEVAEFETEEGLSLGLYGWSLGSSGCGIGGGGLVNWDCRGECGGLGGRWGRGGRRHLVEVFLVVRSCHGRLLQ